MTPTTPTPTTAQVHATVEHVHSIELTPPHPPRTETPIYEALHKRLLFTEDRPCFVCGVRHSDLQDATRAADAAINPYGAVVMESHHVVVERSLLDAVDPVRVAQSYPSVHQFKTFEEWVDGSEDNVKPFCDQCHRLAAHAIHHALWQDVIATKFARIGPDGQPYVFVTDAGATETAAIARDEAIEQGAGIEQAIAAGQNPGAQALSLTPSSASSLTSPVVSGGPIVALTAVPPPLVGNPVRRRSRPGVRASSARLSTPRASRTAAQTGAR